MATLKSTNINAGDPVTADIINNLVLDLNELNKATAASFSLNLASTGDKQGAALVSQKIYSTVIKKKISDGSKTGATWDFVKDGIKFNNAPRCWVEIKNSDTSLPATAFKFDLVITSITTKSMTFQVRGTFSTAEHEFLCFAVDA